MKRGIVMAALALGLSTSVGGAVGLLVEAESFARHGGWKLDTQFVHNMGSPYLLAHGLGRPVEDASTEANFPETGRYHVFARTKDWVAPWDALGQPGKFQVLVEGKALEETFGTRGADWFWHYGGSVEISHANVTVALKDLTGFDGRCDALWFTTDPEEVPPNQPDKLARWRQLQLGHGVDPVLAGPYDLVVVGGGYAGMGTALAAARLGSKVALIQNRPVLGGNGSSEVRVWSMGLIRRGKFPRIGEIVEEFADKAKKSPGTYEEFEDAKKEKLIRAEPNIDLFLNTHADQVEKNGDRITAVLAFNTRTGQWRRFQGRLFADCTGHGVLGEAAGAAYDMTEKGRMGMSNMWRWKNNEEPVTFPQTPWALDLYMKDFPYPRDFHGQWFWESGFDINPIRGAETIRDWNLRAVFGAFNAMKNRDGANEHRRAQLEWVAFIGGPRESRRLLGDVVLTQEDIVSKREFPDGCVPSTWSIDLHYPKKQYAEKFPDNPFISVAEHDRRVDRTFGYPVPYRCFYSTNIPNLFMAGRCISVTHEALGTVRVMKTCGMMGEVVGKAATLCLTYDCDPRDIYDRYLEDLFGLMRLPGKARRSRLDEEIVIPPDALPLASPRGPMSGVNPGQLEGVVLDDKEARREGSWTAGTGLPGYVAFGYLYAGPDTKAQVHFDYTPGQDGPHEILLAYQPHENRGDQVPVTVKWPGQSRLTRIDMKQKPPLAHGFISLGTFPLKKGQPVSITVATTGAQGIVHADAVQILPPQQD